VGAICTDDISSSDDLAILKRDVGDARIFLVPFHLDYLVWTLDLNSNALQLLHKYNLRHILRGEENVRVGGMFL
jgi:hypothetical protein